VHYRQSRIGTKKKTEIKSIEESLSNEKRDGQVQSLDRADAETNEAVSDRERSCGVFQQKNSSDNKLWKDCTGSETSQAKEAYLK
jgi:hypothetical protein